MGRTPRDGVKAQEARITLRMPQGLRDYLEEYGKPVDEIDGAMSLSEVIRLACEEFRDRNPSTFSKSKSAA